MATVIGINGRCGLSIDVHYRNQPNQVLNKMKTGVRNFVTEGQKYEAINVSKLHNLINKLTIEQLVIPYSGFLLRIKLTTEMK